jgi:NitT/TauT family transport system substrate-binding protein
MMNRAEFVAGTAMLGALAWSPARVGAQTLGKVRVITVPIDQGGQPYYAAELGIFAKHGLDADVQSLASGAAIIAALSGGTTDIGNSNVITIASAHEHGLPLQLFSPAGMYYGSAPTAWMLVPKNSPLRTAKDLTGKTIGISNLKSITQISVQDWVDQNGGDSTTLKFVDITFSEMEAALAAERFDAALIADPEATVAIGKGRTRVFATPFDAIGKRFMIGGWVAKPDWIAANGPIVRAFNAALTEAAHWANDRRNHARSAEIFLKYTKVEVGKANRVVYGEHLVADDVQPGINAAAKYQILKAPFPATDLFPAPAFRA